jgi:serine/threonine-protein kinase
VPGQTVTLVVSTGKPEVVVPPIAGASFAAEASALQAKGLKAQEDDVYSDTVPKGQVVQIAPAPGAKARVDSVISVQISKGPHLVTIPNLFGDSVGTATHVLEADGFVVQGVTGNPINTVTGTVPRAGNSVHYGSAVEIVTG